MKDVRAKKHLGQHFLNDTRIASEITNLLSKDTENVIEVGPGMGVLTKFLIKNHYKMISLLVKQIQEKIVLLKENLEQKIYKVIKFKLMVIGGSKI